MGKYDDLIYTFPKLTGTQSDLYASPKAYFNGNDSLKGSDLTMGFSVILHDALVDIPHCHHAVEEIYMFSGADLTKFFDFDAEIEFWIGENPDRMEKYVITKPTLVRIPARMWHGPINYKNVKKPVAFSSVYMNGDRGKVTRRIYPDGTVDYPFLGSKASRCIYDGQKSCTNCGRCIEKCRTENTPHPLMQYALDWAKKIAEKNNRQPTGKYDDLFFEYPVEYHSYGELYANPRGKFRGQLQMPDVNFFGGFSIILGAHFMEVPHCHHARDEYLWFSGANLMDPFDYDAEITIDLGWDPDHMDTITVTEPCMIRMPANMWHGPINFKRIDKPVAFFPAYGDGDWSKIVRKDGPNGIKELVFEAASLRRCVYDSKKTCCYCGACVKDNNVQSFGIFTCEKDEDD